MCKEKRTIYFYDNRCCNFKSIYKLQTLLNISLLLFINLISFSQNKPTIDNLKNINKVIIINDVETKLQQIKYMIYDVYSSAQSSEKSYKIENYTIEQNKLLDAISNNISKINKYINELNSPVFNQDIDVLPNTINRTSTYSLIINLSHNLLDNYNKILIYDNIIYQIKNLLIHTKSIKNIIFQLKNLYENVISTVLVQTNYLLEWYTLENRLSNEISYSVISLENKLELYLEDRSKKIKQFNNLKLNILLIINSLNKEIEEDLNNAIIKINKYNENINNLEKELSYLNSLVKRNRELLNINEDLKIKILENENKIANYTERIKYFKEKLSFYKSSKYYDTYNSCPNKKSYKDCDHFELKESFESDRKVNIEKLISLIQSNEIRRSESAIKINNYKIFITKNEKSISENNIKIKNIPIIENEFKNLKNELIEYQQNTDIFSLFKLKYYLYNQTIFINNLNI